MPGTTPIFGLPFPTGTDRVMDGDNAIAALAQAVENAMLAQAWRWVALNTELFPSGVPLDSTYSGGAATTRVEVTGLPATGVKAITGVVYARHSAGLITAYVAMEHWDVAVQGGVVYGASVNNQGSAFMIRTGGTNNRQIRFTRGSPTGTITYGIRVTGYWTDSPLGALLLERGDDGDASAKPAPE